MSLMSFDFLHTGSAAVLVSTVLVVGVLHTIVPDHWVPITLIARQRGWSKQQTAMAALKAGTGHVLTTLILAGIVWMAGVAVATKFGHWVDIISSIALVGFGLWIAISSWRSMGGESGGHSHGGDGHQHDFTSLNADGDAMTAIHGPELQTADGIHGLLKLSIFEQGQMPKFRFTATKTESIYSLIITTERPDGSVQRFAMVQHPEYWESVEAIPEPHGFKVSMIVGEGTQVKTYVINFAEHEHDHGSHNDTGVAHHTNGISAVPKTSSRTALLLILGSSPMVEGIPAFFAAGKYGPGLIAIMAVVFAISTILTYVLLCVYSTAGLQRVKFGVLERYGEVLSGMFIAAVGVVFWLFPVL